MKVNNRKEKFAALRKYISDQRFVKTDKKLTTYYLVKLQNRKNKPIIAYSDHKLYYGQRIQTEVKMSAYTFFTDGYVVGKIECSGNTMRLFRKDNILGKLPVVEPYKEPEKKSDAERLFGLPFIDGDPILELDRLFESMKTEIFKEDEE